MISKNISEKTGFKTSCRQFLTSAIAIEFFGNNYHAKPDLENENKGIEFKAKLPPFY